MPSGPIEPPIDPKWPKLLSLTVHEFRSPLTVVSGYIRMLLKERAGPIPEAQRRLLEEAEKSCARLSTLLTEVSELSHLEARTAPFNASPVDLAALLADTIAHLPPLPDREVAVDLIADRVGAVRGDAGRLKAAFAAILIALRRELVTSDRLAVRLEPSADHGRPGVRITVGEAIRMDEIRARDRAQRTTFDEWRGGNGLSLPNARRIVEAHAGHLWGVADDERAAAVVELPLA